MILLMIVSVPIVSANEFDGKNETNLQEHLGAKLPLDLSFKDENGKTVYLRDVFKKSTALAFVYYHCPGICTPLMTEIAEVVNKVDLKAGQDYDIVTISMDDRETPKIAKDKKANFMRLVNPDFPDSAWKFLTGDSASIKKAADIAGFHFQRVGKDFIHTAVLIFVSKDGKICRYLYPSYTANVGFDILPFDFKMATIETSEGKLMPTVGKILQFCFSYDPQGKKYVVNILRIFGAGIIFLAVVFVLYLTVKPKKVQSKTR